MSTRLRRDQSGHYTLFESELCDELALAPDQLREWGEMFPPSGSMMHPDRAMLEPYFVLDSAQLRQWTHFAKILRTGMAPAQVKELAARDAKAADRGQRSRFVEMYAALAEECPPGITAHCLRSYCTVLLFQNRFGKMLLAKDLASSAGIPESAAKRHLRYLQAVGLLTLNREEMRWEFAMVPRALSQQS